LIGITATVPVEIILGAGFTPVDLNNLFITSESPEKLVREAEASGFSHSICSWIKGIYATVIERGIQTVIAVTGGDCSNTVALGELLQRRGVTVISFEYPHNRDPRVLKEQMEKLREALSVSWSDIEAVREGLGSVRAKLKVLDRFTYREDVVSGLENHQFLVASSDFNGDPDRFEQELDRFLQSVRERSPRRDEVRLGYLGVPPIFTEFYELIEDLGGRVVFNEMQRQFSMPYDLDDMVEQYLAYTYPYDVEGRIRDVREAIEERRLDGLIHYTQTFCYRQIYDIMLREALPVPMLTLEGDRPGRVDSRTTLRLETFLEMIRDRREIDASV